MSKKKRAPPGRSRAATAPPVAAAAHAPAAEGMPRAPTEKHQRILDAALEAFSEQGYAGTATSEIAKRAGVSEAAIFKHYRTKKDLLLALVTPLLARVVAPRMLAEFRRDVFEREHEDAEALVRALVTNRMAFAMKHQRALRIAVQELPFHPEVRAAVEEMVLRELWPTVDAAIRRLQARGKIVEAPTEIVVRTLVSLMGGWIVHRLILRADHPRDDDAEREILIRLATNAITPR